MLETLLNELSSLLEDSKTKSIPFYSIYLLNYSSLSDW